MLHHDACWVNERGRHMVAIEMACQSWAVTCNWCGLTHWLFGLELGHVLLGFSLGPYLNSNSRVGPFNGSNYILGPAYNFFKEDILLIELPYNFMG